MLELSPGKKAKLYLAMECLGTCRPVDNAEYHLIMYVTVAECLTTFLTKLVPRLAVGWAPARILAVAYMRSVAWISFEQS